MNNEHAPLAPSCNSTCVQRVPPNDYLPYMEPRTHVPTPMKDDFYLPFICSSNGSSNMQIPGTVPINNDPPPPINPDPIVDRLMRENEKLVQEEVLKQAAVTNASTVRGAQFENLISLSFDEEELIRREEERRQKKREKAAAVVLKR